MDRPYSCAEVELVARDAFTEARKVDNAHSLMSSKMALKKCRNKKWRSKGLLLDIFWADCFLQLSFRAEITTELFSWQLYPALSKSCCSKL